MCQGSWSNDDKSRQVFFVISATENDGFLVVHWFHYSTYLQCITTVESIAVQCHYPRQYR